MGKIALRIQLHRLLVPFPRLIQMPLAEFQVAHSFMRRNVVGFLTQHFFQQMASVPKSVVVRQEIGPYSIGLSRPKRLNLKCRIVHFRRARPFESHIIWSQSRHESSHPRPRFDR